MRGSLLPLFPICVISGQFIIGYRLLAIFTPDQPAFRNCHSAFRRPPNSQSAISAPPENT